MGRGLNYLCKWDDSDEDCYRCSHRGILFSCPRDCPDFADVRTYLTPQQKKQRERLMEQLGVKDDERWKKQRERLMEQLGVKDDERWGKHDKD